MIPSKECTMLMFYGSKHPNLVSHYPFESYISSEKLYYSDVLGPAATIL
jgi:hypothetical protein